MQKFKIFGLIIATSIILSGCSSLGIGANNYYDAAPAMNVSESSSKAVVTGGDYSSTYINGDSVDYSYCFNASGKSNKSKSEMLKDYEYMQSFVEEKNGLMENVYNDYRYFDINSDYISSDAKKYISNGFLSYTIQIENEYVPEILEELEKICKNNNFTVTQYTQQIQNYELYTIVNDYDDENYYDTITQEELDKRLKYASIDVRFDYKMPRSGIETFILNVKDIWHSFLDAFGELISFVIYILIIITVLFEAIKFFYKRFKKMQYKYRIKHPEFYPPKDINVNK